MGAALVLYNRHLRRLLFPSLSTPLGVDHLAGCKTGMAVKPGGQWRLRRNPGRFAGEIDKHLLRTVFCERVVTTQLSQRRGENEICVAADDLHEAGFVAILTEMAQKVTCVHFSHFFKR